MKLFIFFELNYIFKIRIDNLNCDKDNNYDNNIFNRGYINDRGKIKTNNKIYIIKFYSILNINFCNHPWIEWIF